MFISFEGIDGAGKSSHIQALVQHLQNQGLQVLQTREPGGTPLAEKLRQLVLNDAMDPLTEALMIFAARRDHVQQVIRPALAQGQWVVCDRFTDATFAYQGHGRGFQLDVLQQLESWVQEGLQPDLTLWFDLPAHTAAERVAQARVADRFERQPLAFFEAVRQGYAQRAAQAPQRFVQVHADQSLEQVRAQVLAAVDQRLQTPSP